MSNALRAQQVQALRRPEYRATHIGSYSGKVYRFPTPLKARRNSLSHAILGSLLVTSGLTAGAIALVPADILNMLPVFHIAFSFFVTFATLLCLTDLRLGKLIKAMLRGFSLMLVVGVIISGASILSEYRSDAVTNDPSVSLSSLG
jgi:hypothetical protein